MGSVSGIFLAGQAENCCTEECLSCFLGNHEYYTGDVDTWINRIPQFNVTPLMNKRVCLYGQEESCNGGLYVAGLEDISTRKAR